MRAALPLSFWFMEGALMLDGVCAWFFQNLLPSCNCRHHAELNRAGNQL